MSNALPGSPAGPDAGLDGAAGGVAGGHRAAVVPAVGDLHELTDIAVATARAVADLLVSLRSTRGFGDPTALRDAGDRTAHELIVATLGRARPDAVILSEEAADDRSRLAASRVWIVDPLDGTREFGESGRVDWAVHIALWDAQRDDLVLGVVALPGLDVVQVSTRVPPVPVHRGGRWRIAVSRSRPPAVAEQVGAALGAELVPMGSAGFKVAAVVTGEVDAYVHAGGQYQWDSAAPVAVARASGLHTSRLDGSPLRYNGPDLSVPDLVVCRPELAESILRVAAATGVDSSR